MKYFFSVIIPVYNRENRLPYVLQSLNDQIFTDFEVIIVDDASTDNSFKVAFEFEMRDKKVLRNEINKERCITRNRGIAEAQGKYICFLDSDDYHLPDHFQKLYDFIVQHDEPRAFFFTNAWNETETGIRTERTCPDFAQYNPFKYFLTYTVNPQRWAVHRDIMKENLFDPDVVICEDMDVSLHIAAKNYTIYQLKERTTVYVAASDSFTNSDNRKVEKELFCYKRIFNRQELRGKLPIIARNRLLSMCHYHLSVMANENKQKINMYKHAIKSFLLYPKGYNGKTNKPLVVMCIYGLPLIGYIIKGTVRWLKK